MSGGRGRWLVPEGADVDLAAVDTTSTDGAPGDEEETKATFRDLRHELRDLQARLWAEGERSLLVVLQAMDGGGKDGTVKHVFRGVNPTGVRVTSFKKPSEDELAHDFLWRVHKVAPGAGEVAVFNRSHYEDVLVAEGTCIVKLFLHISKDEQQARFDRRLERPDKRWKFNPADLDERERWDDYQAAFEEAIARTSTDAAPWYVVPADRKWYRNWAVSRILIETLREIDPQFPTAPADG